MALGRLNFLLMLMIVVGLCTSSSSSSRSQYYANIPIPEHFHGEDYGKKWMFFPDGDGVPRPISLEIPGSSRRVGTRNFSSKIEYRLYTRYNVNNYINLDQSGRPTTTTNIPYKEKISSRPIKIITHGWESSADKNSVINLKNAYLKTADVVVIGVNWGEIADNYMYPLVALDTEPVGKEVGRFIDALADSYGVYGGQVHLIGHSLGAHVMGNAGSATKLKISRITGLDPARPLFEFPSRSETVKLDPSDAEFVDVIHTCGGILGVENSIGHADFYPNSGNAPQPGCGTLQHIMEACSHSRSHYYFAESILYPQSFPCVQCLDWTQYVGNQCSVIPNTFMGEQFNRNLTGRFYLETKSFEF